MKDSTAVYLFGEQISTGILLTLFLLIMLTLLMYCILKSSEEKAKEEKRKESLYRHREMNNADLYQRKH